MTIGTSIRVAGPFIGDGSTVNLDFTYKVFDDADVQVLSRLDNTGLDTELVLGVDYTVSLNPDQDTTPGGRVVLAVALATGRTGFVVSNVSPLQETVFTNSGGFYPTVLNDSLDRLHALHLENREVNSRAVVTPVGETGNLALPPVTNRVGKYLYFNSLGDITASDGTDAGTAVAAVLTELESTSPGGGASLIGKEGGGDLQDIATLVEALDDTSGTQGSQRIGYKSPLSNSVASTVYAAVKSRRATAEGDFGVVFDGTTTNTTALQAAVNALASAGGGTLELSYGLCKTATINRPAGVHIIGQGPYQTRLVATTGLNAPLIQTIGTSGAGVLNRGGVSNLAIIGSGLANTGMIGIREDWVNRSIIRDVHFHGCYIGYRFSNVWQNILDGVHAHGGGAEQNAIGFWGAEVDPSNQNNAVIATGCVAQDVSLYGFRLINANGSKFTSCEAGGGVHGYYCGDPITGTEAFRWAHFQLCLADTNQSHNWYFEKGAATSVKQFQIGSCWGGTSLTGHNFYFSGVSEMVMSNTLAVAAYLSSVRFNNSSRCRLSNSSLRDWNGAVGANPGIAIDNSTVIGVTGNEVYTATPGTGKAVIMTGTSDYATIVGNNLGASYTAVGANNQIASNTVA